MKNQNNLLDKFLQYHQNRGHSPRTIQTYREILSDFLQEKNPLTARTEDLESYLDKFLTLSVNTRNLKIATIKSFFKWLYLYEHIERNPADRLFTIKSNKKETKFISEDDFRKIIARTKPRDKIMYSLGYKCGLRLSEILSLTKDSLILKIKSLIIQGKGGKTRYVPVPDKLWQDILDFSSQFPATCSRLFLSRTGKPMDKPAFYSVWRSRMRKLGINFSPHALRHGCATNWLQKGGNIREVQELLGHSSIRTTERYTHIVSERLRELVNKEN